MPVASANRKDDEGDGFYLEVKLAWSDGSWSRYYSEAIIADMEYDEVSGRYTVTCPSPSTAKTWSITL